MPKKVKSIQSIKAVTPETTSEIPLPSSPTSPALPKLPPELEKKLQALKEKLDSFKAKVLDKFADYIVGIALLPPEQPPKQDTELPPGEEKGEKEKTDKADKEKEEQKINVLVVVDDTTSQKMTKDELYQKFSESSKRLPRKSIKISFLKVSS